MDAGPYRDGLGEDEPLVIASFRDHECCRRYQEAPLRAASCPGPKCIAPARRSSSITAIASAADLLEAHLAQFADQPRETWRRDFDFTIFGVVLGATFGAILMAVEFRDVRSLAILLNFTLLGAITGAFLDRPRNRYRRTGQIQFGLGDILVLTAIVALGIVLWQLLTGR